MCLVWFWLVGNCQSGQSNQEQKSWSRELGLSFSAATSRTLCLHCKATVVHVWNCLDVKSCSVLCPDRWWTRKMCRWLNWTLCSLSLLSLRRHVFFSPREKENHFVMSALTKTKAHKNEVDFDSVFLCDCGSPCLWVQIILWTCLKLLRQSQSLLFCQ